MPIEEKPQLLEFDCTIEGMEDIAWNVKYDPNDKMGLHISGNGQNFHCPVELFGDVTNFLRSKNIIKLNILTRTAPTPGITSTQKSVTLKSTLTLPQIDGQGGTPVTPAPSGPPIDALASFDIGIPSVSAVENNDKVVPKVTVNNNVITSDTKTEVINRPVIRSRIIDGDPKSAEKNAAEIRGLGASGAKKAIKKKHRVEE